MNFIQSIAVQPFTENASSHRHLSVLSQEAHEATAAEGKETVQKIEAEIDQLAAELWGLTEQELEDIRGSLADLHQGEAAVASHKS
ncbi:MAG: hypothetical protein PVF54_09535 [Anaerolineae bacterium]|jgi:hypothetical protein